ncbi:MAG: LPS export ABC transporter periplasmic protein LptC, partial [Nitrospirota bacterium]|nr:LPS export ABC transporter periplasmic protein LptC [Nitrospirota bacterium]
VQTEAGLISWALDASGAALTEKGQKGLLKNVSVSIPYGNEQTLFLKGDEGAVDTEKKEFSLWKNTDLMSVDLKNGYTLHTRGIEWRASQREIVSQGEAMITGSQIEINGNSLRVSLDKQEMIIIGDVRALVH